MTIPITQRSTGPKPPIVTLDGPAGVGKTTLARRVAEALGLPYLDTGAMFRTLALRLGPAVASLPEEELRARCAAWPFALAGTGAATRLSCAGEPVGDEIRTEAVGLLAAQLGTMPAARAILKEAQQKLGARGPLVAEGRDMGTAVFPEARFKFFLDATPEVRALRRQRDLAERGEHEDLAVLTEQIRQRDALDRGRAVAPLRPAEDALIVDTSALDIEGVFRVLIDHMEAQGGRAALI